MDKSDNIVAPIGNYISLCKKRFNRDLITDTLIGVSVNKEIIREIIYKSRDLSKLQVIGSGQFVVNLIHVGRDQRLPIALYENQNLALISTSYRVFSIHTNNLIDKFLILLFKHSRIDLICSYYAERDIRGAISWKDFTSIPISVPPLNKQERIVNKYQTITKYIKLKKRINKLFEKQMTAYYHTLFDNLASYTIKNFGELFTIVRGGRPPRGNKEQEKKYFCAEGGIPWLQVRDVSKKNYKFIDKTSEQLTPEGFKKGRCTMLGGGHIVIVNSASRATVGKIFITGQEISFDVHWWALKHNEQIGLFYLFFLLKDNMQEWVRLTDSSSTSSGNLKMSQLLPLKFKIPTQSLIDKFNNFCEPIFELQKNNEQIIKKLLRFQKCWVESLD